MMMQGRERKKRGGGNRAQSRWGEGRRQGGSSRGRQSIMSASTRRHSTNLWHTYRQTDRPTDRQESGDRKRERRGRREERRTYILKHASNTHRDTQTATQPYASGHTRNAEGFIHTSGKEGDALHAQQMGITHPPHRSLCYKRDVSPLHTPRNAQNTRTQQGRENIEK